MQFYKMTNYIKKLKKKTPNDPNHPVNIYSILLYPNFSNRIKFLSHFSQRKENVISTNKCSLAIAVLSSQLVAPAIHIKKRRAIWKMGRHTDFDFIEETSPPPLLTSLA